MPIDGNDLIELTDDQPEGAPDDFITKVLKEVDNA
jgi:hypothetical protein